MGKRILYNNENVIIDRASLRQAYIDKYFNIYMNNLKIENTNYQEENFLKRRFWSDGTIACFIIKSIDKQCFVDYAISQYNIYDFGVYATPINRKGVSFIPTYPMEIDKDICLIYAQHNKKGILNLVMSYINRIVDVEMVIKQQLKSHKIPFVFTGDETEKDKFKDFFNKINTDINDLYMTGAELDNINVLNLNNGFIIDKLYSLKQQLENELKEYLGINNMGTTEKKEHLINSEVDSNNEVVETSRASIIDVLNIYFENCNKILGTKLKAVYNAPNDLEKEGVDNNEEV
jgi:hypothetical protein